MKTQGLEIVEKALEPDMAYFELQGHLDGNTFEELGKVFRKYLSRKVYRFILDLRKVDHISSAGAGLFVETVGKCQNHHGDIVLVKPMQQVVDIFHILGVCDLFPVVNSKRQAVAFLEQQRV